MRQPSVSSTYAQKASWVVLSGKANGRRENIGEEGEGGCGGWVGGAQEVFSTATHLADVLVLLQTTQVRHQEKTVTKSRSVCKNKILVVHSRIKKKARFEEHATKSSFEVRELTWFYLDSPKTYKLEHTAPSMAKCVHLAGPRNLVVYVTIQP